MDKENLRELTENFLAELLEKGFSMEEVSAELLFQGGCPCGLDGEDDFVEAE